MGGIRSHYGAAFDDTIHLANAALRPAALEGQPQSSPGKAGWYRPLGRTRISVGPGLFDTPGGMEQSPHVGDISGSGSV